MMFLFLRLDLLNKKCIDLIFFFLIYDNEEGMLIVCSPRAQDYRVATLALHLDAIDSRSFRSKASGHVNAEVVWSRIRCNSIKEVFFGIKFVFTFC